MSLSYATATKLKNAGFPQAGKGDIQCEFKLERFTSADPEIKKYPFAYYPTLSELIEECGEYIERIEFLHDQNRIIAYGVTSLYGDGIEIEEAVAALYLAINKK